MRARAERLLKRVQRTTPVRVVNAFGASQAPNFASALAFQGFLSMFPMILGALAIVGFAIRDPATESRAAQLIIQVFPAGAQAELQNALHGVKQSAGWLGIVSVAGLLWSATSIFGTLEFALSEVFGTRQRDFVRQKLMGFLMMALLIVSIGILLVVNALADLLPMPSSVSWIPSFVAGAFVMISFLVLVYRFVPNRTFKLRHVLPGALLAGVLIEVLSLAFPLYARFAGRFNTYGAQFGLFFLLATWFYLLSELLLLGAVYNRFRMGDPRREGVVATPTGQTRDKKRPADEIGEQKAAAGGDGSDGAKSEEASSGRTPPRSFFQRVALPVAVGVALAGGVLRRRRRHQAA